MRPVTRHQARMLGGISFLFAVVLAILFFATDLFNRGRDASGRRTLSGLSRIIHNALGFETRQPVEQRPSDWSDFLER